MSNVFVGLSGGVDSSVAAYLLKKQGYAVTGVFMHCWSSGSSSHSLGITHSSSLGVSCEEEDAEYARRVAERLEIPFYVFDFKEEYKNRVVEYMLEGYRNGITPNPDVMCNKEIKFDIFLREALTMGADYIATGHYVRISTNNELKTNKRINEFIIRKFANSKKIRYSLMTARDKNKDQSYFLWTLNQKQLQHCLFPIGSYLKPKVREIAKKAGLPTWNKKDSQGICFLGKVTIDEFLKQYIPSKKGGVKDEKGNVLGTHDGAWYYTIGQRHGLDLKNAKTPETKPHYVVSKDITTNTIVVAEGDKNLALYQKELILSNVNFINLGHSDVLENVRMSKIEILARVRYRQPLQKAKLIPFTLQTYKLIFEEPQKFIAPGQSAVFYSKAGELIGGGIIKE